MDLSGCDYDEENQHEISDTLSDTPPDQVKTPSRNNLLVSQGFKLLKNVRVGLTLCEENAVNEEHHFEKASQSEQSSYNSSNEMKNVSQENSLDSQNLKLIKVKVDISPCGENSMVDAPKHQFEGPLKSTTSEQEFKDEYPQTVTFFECVGSFAHLIDNLSRGKEMLKEFQTIDFVDEHLNVLKIIDYVESIRQSCETVLNSSQTFSKNQMEKEKKSFSDPTRCKLVPHDPGMRKAVESDQERNYLIKLGPHQPNLARFPSDGKNRFNSQWYQEFPLLEYSISKDAAFCFACFLFPSNSSCSETAWYTTGVKNWGKMKSAGSQKSGKLSAHFKSEAHKKAMIGYCHYLQGNSHIDVLLDKRVRNEMIEAERVRASNNEVINMLLDITRTLCRQGLPFRGTNDDENGNFQQIVRLVARHNGVMKYWLENIDKRSHHVTYLSSESQNEFISLLGMDSKQKIIKEIANAPFYSVFADTTPDSSRKDQMSIVIRFVDDKGCTQERLLRMMVADEKRGQDLAKYIYDTLNEYEIDVSKLAFQSYDFAANMSGKFNGVHKKLSDLVGHNVPYIPCQAHRTNTAVEHSTAASLIISEFFNILEEVYVFFTSSTKRLKQLQPKLETIENSLSLKGLSKTRWTAKAESIKAVEGNLEMILKTLEEIINDAQFDKNTRSTALNLQKKVLNFDFIFSLFFMKNVMYKMKILTEVLEKEELNVLDAIDIIDASVISLEKIRTEESEVNNLLEAVKLFAEKLEIDHISQFKLHHRRRRIPKKLDPNNENEVECDMNQFYRKQFYLVLDTLITSLKDNLKSFINTIAPLYNIFKFPLNRSNLKLEKITEILNLYPPKIRGTVDIHNLQTELETLFHVCENKISTRGTNMTWKELFNVCMEKQSILPAAFKLCKLIVTAGYSVASNERAFSALKLIKNYLRSNTGQERLDAEMILYFEKDLTDAIDLKRPIEMWSTLKQRRVKI